jgi:putative hydrolase of the HAD superfamily
VRRYDAVFLDAQGTLLQARPSVPAIYAAVYRQFGGIATEAEISHAMSQQWAEYRASVDPQTTSFDTSDDMTRHWWADFNRRMARRLGMEERLDQLTDCLWDAFGRPENWELFPDVHDVLAELRERGYRLGLISNWDSRLISMCQRLGLTAYTEFILASAATGMEKPDRRIFEIALSTAGVRPERAVHVGDDYQADVTGALGAGIDAIFIDRSGHASMPVPTIRTLYELLTLLP